MNRWLYLVRATELFQVQKVNCCSRRSVQCSFSAGAGAKVTLLPGKRSAGKSSGKVLDKFEMMWRDLFSDPSQWWDNRAGKPNPRLPDFKHKQSGEALWLIHAPPWVVSKVASISPGDSIFSLAEKLSRYNKAGKFEKTLKIFELMQKEGRDIDRHISIRALNACAALHRLKEGTRIHQNMIRTGCDSDIHVGSSLVDMYAKCGNIDDAWRVFDKMLKRNVVCWNAMLLGFVKCGQGMKALKLFQRMEQEQVKPDSVTFVGVLNACASVAQLEEGKRVHEYIIRSGCEFNLYVANSLVDMYVKCESIDDAWRMFNKMPERNVVGWSAIILGFVKCGQGVKALELLQNMQQEQVKPDSVTFVGVLNACASTVQLEKGKRVHEQIIQAGYECNVYVGSSLIDMYAKCGDIGHAWEVFTKMPKRNVVGWNSMIMGFVKSGQGHKALDLFHRMQQEQVEPNSRTFVGVLNACASTEQVEEGKRVHELIIQSRCECHVHVANSLIDMYGKCGSIDNAWKVFNKMPKRDVVGWTAMIVGFVKCGQGLKALELFHQRMQQEQVEPNAVTFAGLLNACASTAQLEEGKRIHKHIIQSGCQSDIYIGSSLVDMYSKCGSVDEAWKVFHKMSKRNVVGWNSMLLGFVKCGHGLKALELFQRMQLELVEADSVTFVAVLNACASIEQLEEGKQVHEHIIQSGLECDVYVANALIDMYAKCGSMDDAWIVFNRMPKHNVVSWNAIILGFVKCGQGLKALEQFKKMQLEAVEPDSLTFVGVLNACASVAALETGKNIHRQIIEAGLKLDVYLSTSLVDMYAKCGSLEDAEKLFAELSTRDVTAWTAMLMGYAMHGRAKEAVAIFEEMIFAGSEIDEATFVCLLSACSHGGLLKEGMKYFDSMTSVYGVSPTSEHYSCMVDLLARSGHLDDAEAMVKGMPFEPSAAVWMAILGACRIYGNVEMGERASKRVLELDNTSASSYVLLSHIYAAAGDYQSTPTVQEQRLEMGVMKQPS